MVVYFKDFISYHGEAGSIGLLGNAVVIKVVVIVLEVVVLVAVMILEVSGGSSSSIHNMLKFIVVLQN